ncbi:MAG: riboflavin kinase, partial [Pseudomonadales bacterium]
NLGVRPAVNSLEHPLLEVHLLDWQRNLYGQDLRVRFLKRLRDEMKFDSLAALKDAIQKDVQNARNWFASQAVSA